MVPDMIVVTYFGVLDNHSPTIFIARQNVTQKLEERELEVVFIQELSLPSLQTDKK